MFSRFFDLDFLVDEMKILSLNILFIIVMRKKNTKNWRGDTPTKEDGCNTQNKN